MFKKKPGSIYSPGNKLDTFCTAMIAGTHSSVGKTTWSLALMSYFRKKGMEVQPFKVGPDYIDPGFHNRICHPRKSRNLDRFFLSENYLKDSFQKNSAGADMVLVEGVMGLFDGKSPLSEEGSTAQMAKLLGLPVFLVIDGAGLARSAAALVKGYQTFDPELNLRGILINHVNGEGHFRWLRDPIEKETGIPVLGCLANDPQVSIPERHLGLRTVLEEEKIQEKFNRLGELLEGRFEEERFLVIARRPKADEAISKGLLRRPVGAPRNDYVCRIGVAYDAAFSFYYEDNFDLLREAGAELVFFSPLEDAMLAPDLDALYFGGGFPEIFAQRLSRNESLRNSIRKFHEDGGLIYAECGGLMYLTESLVDSGGERFPLVGLLPGEIRMTDRLQHFGYHEAECQIPTFLFPAGRKIRSHEFHHSLWQEGEGKFSKPYRIGDRAEGFYDGRLLASYQHLHFGQDPALARNFVAAIQRQKVP